MHNIQTQGNILYTIYKLKEIYYTQYTNPRKYIIHNIQTQGNVLYTIYKPKEI